ncbi:MAG: Asp23/Gls24 family envelope stress response protein [Mogibacterium sp.]|nr:Asp23/Gls24 family envelope stress response protein [Mogibacterium sp.]
MNDDINLIDLIEKDIIAFDGVSRFPGFSLSENIQKAIGMDIQNPGIKISEDDGALTINCEIIVFFGVNIPQLCYDIQSKVKRDIEEKTDFTVKAVNIRVEGLDKKEKN